MLSSLLGSEIRFHMKFFEPRQRMLRTCFPSYLHLSLLCLDSPRCSFCLLVIEGFKYLKLSYVLAGFHNIFKCKCPLLTMLRDKSLLKSKPVSSTTMLLLSVFSLSLSFLPHSDHCHVLIFYSVDVRIA